ncbi:maleate cis-trans isomerase family protein [Bosea sp. PAMC 26642]|uniref:maleate cis-trans isomerase family protein n=1 Tax=Bosea sp. (strain PAMC 26642) TaxID=1792307 RepID=UPI001F47FD2C|nr:Asp/Glu/hydantoin racemase [Bosea sp. PAMC 26642]
MLTPSSNTVLEPVTNAMLAGVPGISAHFSRFKVTEIALDPSALAQFDDSEILRAAELLAHAKVDVIAWNGTSASWLGIERDRALAQRITAATGIRASTCILALVDILERIGATSQAVVSPYTDDVQEKIIATFAAAGIACPAERHLRIRDNFAFGTISEEVIAGLIAEVAAAAPDVVTVLCTNMNGARVATEAETKEGPLMLDSVAVTLWGCLMAAGVSVELLAPWGRLFRDPRLTARAS